MKKKMVCSTSIGMAYFLTRMGAATATKVLLLVGCWFAGAGPHVIMAAPPGRSAPPTAPPASKPVLSPAAGSKAPAPGTSKTPPPAYAPVNPRKIPPPPPYVPKMPPPEAPPIPDETGTFMN